MSSAARILDFIEFQGIKKSVFYAKTGLSNGYLDKVKVLGADKIESIITNYPELNLHWLITGKGPMILSKKDALPPTVVEENNTITESDKQIPPDAQGSYDRKFDRKLTGNVRNVSGKEENQGNLLREPDTVYNFGVPKIITVDASGIDNIVHVPVKARAGYLLGYEDAEYISELPTYHLPGLRNASFRSFEVEGLSMAPTIQPRDYVIGEWVPNAEEIRDNRIHIVVTRNDGIVVKRVLNRIPQRGKVYLRSDTLKYKGDYPTLEIDPSDILEIWYARMKFSTDFSEPADIYTRMSNLEIDLVEIKERLKTIG